eukprot:scaffold10720_cov69-Phaeocystis_antarctica.AAC.3
MRMRSCGGHNTAGKIEVSQRLGRNDVQLRAVHRRLSADWCKGELLGAEAERRAPLKRGPWTVVASIGRLSRWRVARAAGGGAKQHTSRHANVKAVALCLVAEANGVACHSALRTHPCLPAEPKAARRLLNSRARPARVHPQRSTGSGRRRPRCHNRQRELRQRASTAYLAYSVQRDAVSGATHQFHAVERVAAAAIDWIGNHQVFRDVGIGIELHSDWGRTRRGDGEGVVHTAWRCLPALPAQRELAFVVLGYVQRLGAAEWPRRRRRAPPPRLQKEGTRDGIAATVHDTSERGDITQPGGVGGGQLEADKGSGRQGRQARRRKQATPQWGCELDGTKRLVGCNMPRGHAVDYLRLVRRLDCVGADDRNWHNVQIDEGAVWPRIGRRMARHGHILQSRGRRKDTDHCCHGHGVADIAVPASCQLVAPSHVAVCARRHTANDTIGLSWEAKTPSHSTRATPPAANADRPASLRSVGSASTSGGSASQAKGSEITSVDTPAIGHEMSTESVQRAGASYHAIAPLGDDVAWERNGGSAVGRSGAETPHGAAAFLTITEKARSRPLKRESVAAAHVGVEPGEHGHALQRHVRAAVPLAVLRRVAPLKAQLDARNPGQGICKTAPAGGERVFSQQTQWPFRLHGGVGALERTEWRQCGGLDNAVAQQQRRLASVACYTSLPLAASTVEAVDFCPIKNGTAAHVQAVDDVASARRHCVDEERRRYGALAVAVCIARCHAQNRLRVVARRSAHELRGGVGKHNLAEPPVMLRARQDVVGAARRAEAPLEASHAYL